MPGPWWSWFANLGTRPKQVHGKRKVNRKIGIEANLVGALEHEWYVYIFLHILGMEYIYIYRIYGVYWNIWCLYDLYGIYGIYIGNVSHHPNWRSHKMMISRQIRPRLCFAMGSQRDAKLRAKRDMSFRLSTVIRSWLLVITCYNWL